MCWMRSERIHPLIAYLTVSAKAGGRPACSVRWSSSPLSRQSLKTMAEPCSGATWLGLGLGLRLRLRLRLALG